jgi:acetyltransferase-like isoleucine patch superfamily enzyme
LVNKKINSQKKSENLHDELKILYKKLRQDTKKEWDRVLPFEEMLFDRWEKAKFLKAKIGSSVYANSYIYGNVIIGKNTWIGPFTLLDGSGGKLSIGSYCSISSGVQIYTHDSVKWAVTGGKAKYEKEATKIGSYCHIGANSIILKGTKIGNHSIIGANSLVKSDIPSFSIATGTPAKVIGKIKIKGSKVDFKYFKKEKKDVK